MSASAWASRSWPASLLIIPIESIIWLLALPSGLLIGYYANQRSNRVAGPWSRILVNGAFAGLATGLTVGGPAPPHQGDLLLRRLGLPRLQPGRRERQPDPALLPVGSGLHVPALPRRGTRSGPRRGRRHGRRVVHELLLGRAGRDGQHARPGDDDRWPRRRRAVRRLPPEARGGGRRDEDRGRRRLVRLVSRRPGSSARGIETPRSNRGVVGAAGCRAIPWSWPSWPWAPPWRSPSVRPWVPPSRRSRPSSERPWSRVAFVALAFVPVALVVVALAAGATAAVVADASRRSLGRSGLGAGGLAQRGAGLAGGRLGALGLAGLAGRDAGLGGLGRGGLAGRLDDAATGLHVLATEGGVDLAGQARLAARGGVRVDGTDLGGAVEGAQRLGQGGLGIDRGFGRLRGRQSGPSRRRSSRRCGAAGGCRGGSGPDGPS